MFTIVIESEWTAVKKNEKEGSSQFFLEMCYTLYCAL